jgi:hypothetical protein
LLVIAFIGHKRPQIVRSSSDGTAYEDTVDHLSESEREVTGLVFALAGYLVHDVYETVPFVLLDSLEAIDSDRIVRAVAYFRTHADYLVAALLPEDAAALPDEYAYVEQIDRPAADSPSVPVTSRFLRPRGSVLFHYTITFVISLISCS